MTMTVGHRVGWIIAFTAVVGLSVTALVLGASDEGFPSAILTGSLAWSIAMTPSMAAALGVVIWCVRRGFTRLAWWMWGTCLAVALYWAAPAFGSALGGTPLEATWFYTALATIGAAGWTVVIVMLQLTAFAAAEAALGRRIARPAQYLLIGLTAAEVLFSALFPFFEFAVLHPTMPTVFAPEVGASAVDDVLLAVVYIAWCIALFVAPIVLWTGAARARGTERRAYARFALGSMLPALVVALCGVLAGMERAAAVGYEIGGLAIGFSIALPLTLGWLAATVRDSATASARATSTSAVVRVLLWVAYVFLAGQIAMALNGLMDGGTAGMGALVATALLVVTFVPWRLLVAWCVRLVDPRAAIAAAIVRADRDGAPAVVAQRALCEALGDPHARLLVAADDGWLTSDGAHADEPTDGASLDADAVLPIAGSRGRTIALVTTRARFVDARPLLDAVRPLAERASLEAEARIAAEAAAAERRRAAGAADDARRRIERDLHDGVQGRLVSLGLELGLVREDVADPVARGILDETISNLHTAVLELRELSSGGLSQRLAGSGLATAVADLTARMPMPVDLDIRPPALASSTETTAYFVIAEALANVVKHARARTASVTVTGDDDVLVEIADDGDGGADLRAGTGLRGLQERVHAVGGRLIVSERAPHGTRVEAILPCGS